MGEENSVIARAYDSIIEELDSDSLNFPTSFDLIERANLLMMNENSSIKEYVTLIRSEPVLSAKVLRAANTIGNRSFHYEVTSIMEAVQRLGTKHIRCLVYYVSFEQFQRDCRSPAIRKLALAIWKHSLDVGCWSYSISKELNIEEANSAMLAGLMVDIGQFFILSIIHKYSALSNDEELITSLIVKYNGAIAKKILDVFKLNALVCEVYDDFGINHNSIWPVNTLADLVMLSTLITDKPNPFLTSIETFKRALFEDELNSLERRRINTLVDKTKCCHDSLYQCLSN